jgi:uncharacterized protein involved in outer membrane biogenesis
MSLILMRSILYLVTLALTLMIRVVLILVLGVTSRFNWDRYRKGFNST